MFMSFSNSLAGQDAGREALSSTPGTGPGKINYYLKVRSELEKIEIRKQGNKRIEVKRMTN